MGRFKKPDHFAAAADAVARAALARSIAPRRSKPQMASFTEARASSGVSPCDERHFAGRAGINLYQLGTRGLQRQLWRWIRVLGDFRTGTVPAVAIQPPQLIADSTPEYSIWQIATTRCCWPTHSL